MFTVLAAAACATDRPPDENPGAGRGDSATEAISGRAAVPGAGSDDRSGGAPVTLAPDEYQLWQGDWYEASSGSIEDNVYFRLEIFAADQHGLQYQLVRRSVPYGPNEEWSGERTARFDGPVRATDTATGHVFLMSVDPSGAYQRTVEVQVGSPDGPGRDATLRPDPAGGTFVLDGAMSGPISTSAYQAGFDCEQAATPVETTICGNELLAQGDLEMNVLYREAIGSVGAARERSLRSGQREFILRRDNECQRTDGGVDEGCVARLYSDRLVALRRLGDPSLGGGRGFDADFARVLLRAGTDLRRNTEARLAMYPFEMRVLETGDRVTDESGVLYEQTYVDTKIIWPADVEIRYSDMLFVGSGGMVWTAAHMTPADSVRWSELQSEYQFEAWQLEQHAGRGFLTIWPETDENQPNLVGAWLDRHPLPDYVGFRQQE